MFYYLCAIYKSFWKKSTEKKRNLFPPEIANRTIAKLNQYFNNLPYIYSLYKSSSINKRLQSFLIITSMIALGYLISELLQIQSVHSEATYLRNRTLLWWSSNDQRWLFICSPVMINFHDICTCTTQVYY